MNIKNVRKLRDLLREVAEKNPRRFFMAGWFGRRGFASSVDEIARMYPSPDKCGTAACMAGWAQAAFANGEDERTRHCSHFARDFCGIDCYQEYSWFRGRWSAKDLKDITATEAADFLTERLRVAGAEP